jgi:hypothetical protein
MTVLETARAGSSRTNGRRPPVAQAAGADYEVVHQLRGRVRVRIAALSVVPGYAEGFEVAFASQLGVVSVRVNRWCASAVIE